MDICERCGWFTPIDCTCRRPGDQVSRARLRSLVAERHREAVDRARTAGWPDRSTPDDPPEDAAAG